MGRINKKQVSFQQTIKNIMDIMRMVWDMDASYLPLSCVVHGIRTGVFYIGLLLSADILNCIIDQRASEELFLVGILAGSGMFFLHLIADFLWNRLEIRRECIYKRFHCKVQEKLLRMDFSQIDSPKIREWLERIKQDNQWGSGINTILWNMHRLILCTCYLMGAGLLGASVIVYFLSLEKWELLGWFCLFFGFFIFIVIGIKVKQCFERKQENYMYATLTEEERKEEKNFCWSFGYGDWVQDKNGTEIRLYGGYELLKNWTTDVLLRKASQKRLLEGAKGFGGSMCIYNMILGTMKGGSYLLVGLLAIMGRMPIGSFVRYAICLNYLVSNLFQFCSIFSELNIAVQSQRSTLEILKVEQEMYQGKLPVEKRSDREYRIEFRNVSFRYPGTEQYALQHVSFQLQAGEKLAIVGRNGSGKTTLIKLLCRLYDPDEGEILLNGVDIRKLKQEEYRQLFSVIFQDYVLFAFPLAQNVAVNTNYDSALVEQCLKAVGFDESLSKLPNGIQTYLFQDYMENGVEIQSEEAQKIALARTIYKESSFLLLDEPTETLDALAEYKIYTQLNKIIGTKTVIYISHRLYSCQFCKKIAVFQNGQLVQLGSHKELLENKEGEYSKMWEAQYYQKKDSRFCTGLEES